MEAKKEISETSVEETERERPAPSSEKAFREVSPGTNGDDESHPMDALLEGESYELEMPRRGEIRIGTVARVTETDVLVDVGAKSEGVIPARELERIPEEQRTELVVGKEVEVYVLRSGARDGNLILSVSRAQEEQDWRQAEALLESRDLFEGIVSGFNKGGLIIKMGRLRGFVPASQVSLSRRRRAHGSTPDQRWGKMVDEPIIAKVIEVDRRRNRLILSERAATREARDALKERLITELEPGEIRQGHVISLADFGAFVDIGGADGLVHMSEISWKRISHPRDVLKVGQKVEVKVLSVDPERKRISLSMRELESNPWDKIVDQYQEGQLVEGTITKLTKFGAFASLAGTEEFDIEGLIHISELADRRVEHPREVVQEGQALALRVIKIDRERKRIGLSLKRVSSAEYAEQDWQAAMKDIDEMEEDGIGVAISEEVEDFDAALEAEVGEVPDTVDEVEELATAEQPEQQVDEVVPDEPVDVDVSDEPVDVDVSDEPVDVDVSDEPVDVDVSDEPVDVDVPDEPVDEVVPDEPVDEVVPDEPVDVDVSDEPVDAEIEQPIEEVETVDEQVSTLEEEMGEDVSLSAAPVKEEREEEPPVSEDVEADIEPNDPGGGTDAAM
ncbi:MAG: S1 RNA-binding domain-containing protein [Anaerolineales bacterium]|nr:S1 RNA-binding domain-containing protein [Anaerolineales bacterium]